MPDSIVKVVKIGFAITSYPFATLRRCRVTPRGASSSQIGSAPTLWNLTPLHWNMSTANTYSSLIRRSKLASYSSQIDQVYTTSPANRSRNQYGLKRPLPPSASRNNVPLVRVNELDTAQGRTMYRPATKEASFVKKWNELQQHLQVDTTSSNTVMPGQSQHVLQSRFVPQPAPREAAEGDSEGQAGSPPMIKDGFIQPVSAARGPLRRTPNLFAMARDEFERFIDQLGEQREAFRAFVATEQAKTQRSSPGANTSAEDIDLYEHAQQNPTQLIRLLERFLSSSSSSSAASKLKSNPHPMLALQYSTPTPLEAALFTPPVPGRLLGPSPSYQAHSHRPSTLTANNEQLYASIAGQVAPIGHYQTNGSSFTTFFPDATGQRSNQPGRVAFHLVPSIRPSVWVSKQAQAARRGQKAVAFGQGTSGRGGGVGPGGDVAAHEPAALASMRGGMLQLRPEAAQAPPRALPGTQAYSGDLPPASSSARRSSFSFSAGGRGGADSTPSLTEIVSRTHLGAQRTPRQGSDLYPSQYRHSKSENVARSKRREAMIEERRATDGKAFGLEGAGAGSKGRRVKGGGEKGQEKSARLLKTLHLLLNEQP